VSTEAPVGRLQAETVAAVLTGRDLPGAGVVHLPDLAFASRDDGVDLLGVGLAGDFEAALRAVLEPVEVPRVRLIGSAEASTRPPEEAYLRVRTDAPESGIVRVVVEVCVAAGMPLSAVAVRWVRQPDEEWRPVGPPTVLSA
jgi:hypothetical protein